MVFGEITTKSPVDFQKVIRGAIKKIGYDSSEKGFDYNSERAVQLEQFKLANIIRSL